MRRIWVIGASGSGKSTLAAELARRLEVPHAELDGMHHGPNWAEPDPDEFRAAVAAVVAGESWVIDGGYRDKLGDMVPLAADTLVWIDLPLRTTLGRVARRSAARLWHRTELWNGNRESLRAVVWGRESLLWWAAKRHREYRRELPARFARPEYAGKAVVRLRSPQAVRAWLQSVPRPTPGASGRSAPAAR
jgi:adenylate kinase family enzyme